SSRRRRSAKSSSAGVRRSGRNSCRSDLRSGTPSETTHIEGTQMDQERDLDIAASTDDRTQLFKVREALLNLHKAVLNVERKRYELNVGPVANEFEFFRLAT